MPIEPKPPQKTKDASFIISPLSSLIRRRVFTFSNAISQNSLEQLSELDISSSEGKEKGLQIIFREFYLDEREKMECSEDEGYGVSPALDGLYGEKLTVFELELCVFAGFKGNILHNLEIEVGNRTIQIDVLFITQKGIFVIESKNYSGSISGAEYQNKWLLRTRKKDYRFSNPIAQNQTHINTLRHLVRVSRFYSLIAFSERCDLEYIDIHSQGVFVFHRHALSNVIQDVFANEPDVLSVSDVEAVTAVLRRYCADDPVANPDYKENRGYFSASARMNEHPNASYHHKRSGKQGRKYSKSFYEYDDYYDDDYDDDYDDYDDD